MNKKLEKYIETLTLTNRTLDQLVDVYKVQNNMNKIQMDLNALNYILGNSVEETMNKIDHLWESNKECFKTLLLILAIKENKMLVVEDGIDFEILEFVKTKEGVKNLLNKTNMISLLSNGSIKNLVDYCYGIEVGMDTNARKNRGGSKIESYIESELQKIFKDRKEITINTQSIVLKNGEIELLDNKRFDLVIKNINTNKIILIEISWFNAGGSKINSNAKEYNEYNEQIKKIDNLKFIWLGDGKGMTSIKKNLEKFIDNDFIYNHDQFLTEIKKLI